MHSIEDSLDLHSAPFALIDGLLALPSKQGFGRNAPLSAIQIPNVYPQILRTSHFLKHLESFDHIPAILNEPIFQKGFDIAEVSHLSSDQYDAYLKSIWEYNEAKAVLDTAFMDGKSEGKVEGRIEGKIEGKIKGKTEVAKTMLAEGFDVSVIAKVMGLTQEKIEKL